MTDIRYSDYNITFKGHAEQTDVCTAISTLMFTLIHNLNVLQQQKKLDELSVKCDEGKGNAEITFFPEHNSLVEVKTAFDTCINGLILLSFHFPDCLTVTQTDDI